MKKHLFLIDDDEDELTILMEAMNQVNTPYKCTWAQSGDQAIKQLAYLTPDLIILDFNMPGMDGLECLAAIKKLPRVRNIPVVFHSSAITPECKEKAMKLGATACLVKPENYTALAETLREFLTAQAVAMTE